MLSKLLTSWKESLTLFLPGSAKLFLLVTLKTLLSTYKNLLLYCSWALVLSIIATSYLIKMPGAWFWYFNPAWILFLWVFCIVLSARPSVLLKSFGYYAHYWTHALFLAIVSILVSIGFQTVLFAALASAGMQSPVTTYAIALPLYPLIFLFFFSLDIYLWFLSPWLLFTMLFVADSLPSFSRFCISLWRAMKMIVYNYPFCLIIYFAFRFALGYVPYGLRLVGAPIIVANAVMLILLPIPLVFFICFYTKRLHDQFGYYFPKDANRS